MALNFNANDMQALSDLLAEGDASGGVGGADSDDDSDTKKPVGGAAAAAGGAAAPGNAGDTKQTVVAEAPYKTVIKTAQQLKEEKEAAAAAGAGGAAAAAGDAKQSGTAAAGASSGSSSGAASKSRNTIWDDSDVTASIVDDDTSDGRLRAEYEFVYKQRVTSGDVYLNMGFKDISAESCESLVVRLQFPNDARASDIDLIVKRDYLRAISKTHKLYLPLPHIVDPDGGRAQFDAKKRVLIVTLPILWDA